MKLHQLTGIVHQSKKRPGRGYGSGAGGHTSTRGQKGQQARSKVAIWFEGGQLPLTKRIPFLRGKGRLQSLHAQVVLVKTSQLDVFEAGAVVDLAALVKAGIVSDRLAVTQPVKILFDKPVSKPLTLKGLALSAQAATSIQAAKGSVEATPAA